MREAFERRGLKNYRRRVMPDYGLRGRVALVTGGNTGIGAATVRALLHEGASVAIAYYQQAERAQALVAEASAQGQCAAAFYADLGNPEATTPLLDAVEQALGPLAILVNNAAHSTRDGYSRLDAATLDQHFAVNARATALLTSAFAQRYNGGVGGRIICLTSGQGLGPMVGELAYAASKGAVEALVRSFAAELAPLGITVNAVDPGVTDTGWIDDALRADLLQQAPFGRIGTSEDAARLIVFLASRQADWITGEVVRSRGGM
jgi:3-oxoacyl-[acyl-carrier protein] reductase